MIVSGVFCVMLVKSQFCVDSGIELSSTRKRKYSSYGGIELNMYNKWLDKFDVIKRT